MASDVVPEWPLKDIIYTGIVGSVMLAALLEWFLWVAAFMYCLIKAFQKAEHWSSRVLAVVVGFLFVGLRLIFLPIMIFTLPLPSAATKYFPTEITRVLQWIAFYAFIIVLSVPWIICIYQHVTSKLGRKKRMKQILDDDTAPKIVVVMPVFKEDVEVLITAINSVVDCDYPPACIHVFLSFDGDQVDELYLATLKALGIPNLSSPPVSLDITYRQSLITVSRFKHGGKRNCQKRTFALIDRVYAQYIMRNDDMFVLFIDSDCILDNVCLQNFMYDMELSPNNKRDTLAATGVITATTRNRKRSLLILLQDLEYVHGQLFERVVEGGCGATVCLPGALTCLRFSAFRNIAKYYFTDTISGCSDLFDYGKCHLGEDRWLTHLLMVAAAKPYQIQMCTSAFCKTEAVQTFKSLVKQRRRWFLGFITNEVCMLTDWRIWRKYPILALIRFLQNTIRTTALLFFILVIALATTSKQPKDLPLQFIGVSLGLNWVMMIWFGFKIGRLKAWLYPLMFVFNPFFNFYYMTYGILTAGQRTWGGPRADAAKADANISPTEAVEKAEEEGDDLNVVPETFIPAGVIRRKSTPLHPPRRLEGRFAAPILSAEGWYIHDESPVAPGRPWIGGRDNHGDSSRDSFDTFVTKAESVPMPRRLESIMAEEERIGLNRADIAQRQRQYRQIPRVVGVFPRPGSPEVLAPSHPLRNCVAVSDLRGAGGMESQLSIDETLVSTRSPTPMMPPMAVLPENVTRSASDSDSDSDENERIRRDRPLAQARAAPAPAPAPRQQLNAGPPPKLKHVYKRLPQR